MVILGAKVNKQYSQRVVNSYVVVIEDEAVAEMTTLKRSRLSSYLLCGCNSHLRSWLIELENIEDDEEYGHSANLMRWH